MPVFIAFFLVAIIAAFLVSSSVTAPQKKQVSLEDFDFPQVSEGTPHAVVFGDAWLEGWQVLHYGNFRTTKVKSRGKK